MLGLRKDIESSSHEGMREQFFEFVDGSGVVDAVTIERPSMTSRLRQVLVRGKRGLILAFAFFSCLYLAYSLGNRNSKEANGESTRGDSGKTGRDEVISDNRIDSESYQDLELILNFGVDSFSTTPPPLYGRHMGIQGLRPGRFASKRACDKQPFEEDRINVDVRLRLNEYWKDLRNVSDAELWKQEYETHGSCLKHLFPDENRYFDAALRLRTEKEFNKRINWFANMGSSCLYSERGIWPCYTSFFDPILVTQQIYFAADPTHHVGMRCTFNTTIESRLCLQSVTYCYRAKSEFDIVPISCPLQINDIKVEERCDDKGMMSPLSTCFVSKYPIYG